MLKKIRGEGLVQGFGIGPFLAEAETVGVAALIRVSGRSLHSAIRWTVLLALCDTTCRHSD